MYNLKNLIDGKLVPSVSGEVIDAMEPDGQ